jgi:protein farnesyltransferase/geranylgeranyltransferase type-1 subunit alpha
LLTVRLYRAKIILSTPTSELPATLLTELEFLNPLSLKHLKNYQIWQHRQTIITALGQWQQDPPFLEKMLALDAKNYHVWSYRQWMVNHFNLWDEKVESDYVEKLLDEDVRNNSAWNHRWFLMFGRLEGNAELAKKEVVKREWDWAMEKIEKAPQNESAWNYIRGLLNKGEGAGKIEIHEAIEAVKPYGETTVRSSYALDVLAMLYAEAGQTQEACDALDKLAEKYDPIRSGYWMYRKRQIRPDTQPIAVS